MKIFSRLLIVFWVFYNSAVFTQNNDFIRGVDISFTPQIEDLGGKYKLNGVVKDVLDILKEKGINYVRLRIWHTPSDGYCGLEKTLQFAKRIKQKGFKFLLDFHYSDWWADPGKQNKPNAWLNLSFESLKDSVYAYTKFVLTELKNQNTLPDMVQIGNEITGGMLWPDGKLYNMPNPDEQWIKFGQLVNSGIKGAKDVDQNIKIMIHIDRGGDNKGAVYFFNRLLAQNVNFDVIGLSYYPWWHGTLTQLQNNLNDLAVRYNKDIVVVETAYPWTLQYQNDGHGNIVGQNTALLQGYPATPSGQKDYLIFLQKIIKDTKNGKGIGFFYWEPTYISVPPIGSSWENLTLFSFTNSNLESEALKSLDAFLPNAELPMINVTIRVNTSTLGDTLKTNGIVQIRGEVKGKSSSLLPSGERISWDSLSQLILKNVDGDYWQYTFKMYKDDTLEYKIWTGHTKTKGTYLRAGWEGPIIPYDGSNKNARLFIAKDHDTILPFQYINNSQNYVEQYFSPISHKDDSIGVLFRVNLADMINKGLFGSEGKGQITLRGDSIQSEGKLSWESDKFVLKREEGSVANSSFWSGIVYFPKNKIEQHRKIYYKFFIKDSLFSGTEEGIENRFFYFPSNDTTLYWKFFNDKKLITKVEENFFIPHNSNLFQNYPNPFNSVTKIQYTIPNYQYVTLNVYNMLGQKVATLVNEYKSAGNYLETFDASTLASGVYFYTLRTGNFTQTRKMILLK